MDIASIENLLEPVIQAGDAAREALSDPRSLEAELKADGSVLTKMDRATEDALVGEIRRNWPAANIVSEETELPFDPACPYSFALDPIDGTDSFSQGMAGWCVSVGLLHGINGSLQPVAGIIYAPMMDLLLFADIGQPVTRNGVSVRLRKNPPAMTKRTNLMAYSKIHKGLDLSDYPGKIRSIGSAALHLCAPAIYSNVIGALEAPRTHIWDIAGAHAISKSLGLEVDYLSGGSIDYAPLLRRGPVTDFVLCCRREAGKGLRNALEPKKN